MRQTIIKNISMDWETEELRFKFLPCGDRLDALDELKDTIEALGLLYEKILKYGYEDDFPIKVEYKHHRYVAQYFNGKCEVI